MLFVRSDGPPGIEPEFMLGLRFSLNTPVVRTDDLPVGPARAALLMFRSEGAADDLSLTVGVRSLKSGEVVYFQPDRQVGNAAESLDAGMAFGEGMGFLFDEDEIADGDTERAYGMWSDLMGAPATMGAIGSAVDPLSEISEDFSSEMLLTEEVADAGDSQPILEIQPEITQPPAPPDTNLLTSMIESALATASSPLPPPTPLEDLGPLEASGEESEESEESDEPAQLDAPSLTKFRTPEFGGMTDDELDDTPALADPIEAGASLTPVLAEVLPAEVASLDEQGSHPPEPEASQEPESPSSPKRKSRGRAALGKLRLVKKRKLAADDDRSHFLARILSSF